MRAMSTALCGHVQCWTAFCFLPYRNEAIDYWYSRVLIRLWTLIVTHGPLEARAALVTFLRAGKQQNSSRTQTKISRRSCWWSQGCCGCFAVVVVHRRRQTPHGAWSMYDTWKYLRQHFEERSMLRGVIEHDCGCSRMWESTQQTMSSRRVLTVEAPLVVMWWCTTCRLWRGGRSYRFLALWYYNSSDLKIRKRTLGFGLFWVH